MCKLVEDYANMRAAEEAQKAVEEMTRESVAQLVKLSIEQLNTISQEIHSAQ